jgi:hypothetical protein
MLDSKYIGSRTLPMSGKESFWSFIRKHSIMVRLDRGQCLGLARTGRFERTPKRLLASMDLPASSICHAEPWPWSQQSFRLESECLEVGPSVRRWRHRQIPLQDNAVSITTSECHLVSISQAESSVDSESQSHRQTKLRSKKDMTETA